MRMLRMYLVALIASAAAVFAEMRPNDGVDVALLSVAVLLLSAVVYFLMLAGLALFRAVRYHPGPDLTDTWLIFHGAVRDHLIPWEEIADMEVVLIAFGRMGLKRPVFRVYWKGRKSPFEVYGRDMPDLIARIQEKVRARSPHYRKGNVDLAQEWRDRIGG